MSDQIAIRGLRVRGRHGVLEEERRQGQVFVVDLALGLNLATAASTDALADTVDYADLAGRVAEVVGGERWDLIERVAERVAETILLDPRVGEVEVTVHKPEAPLPVPVDDVSVTVVRRRPGTG